MDTVPATPAAPGAWTADESRALEDFEVRVGEIFNEIKVFYGWMQALTCLMKMRKEIHNNDFVPSPNEMESEYLIDLLRIAGGLLEESREFSNRDHDAANIIKAAKEAVCSSVVGSVTGVIADARIVAYRNLKVAELIQNWEAAKLNDKAKDLAEKMDGIVWTESQKLKEMALHHVQNQ